mmetsp:Transcript_15712/g.46603  ORF Transcript_15712/g.46603 Transcript_15712/m.46603 type:complete len:374 (+) Transcript_15712:345-1466(+)
MAAANHARTLAARAGVHGTPQRRQRHSRSSRRAGQICRRCRMDGPSNELCLCTRQRLRGCPRRRMPGCGALVDHCTVGLHLHCLEAALRQASPRAMGAHFVTDALIHNLCGFPHSAYLLFNRPSQWHHADFLCAAMNDDIREHSGVAESDCLPAGDLCNGAHEVAGEREGAKRWLHANAVARDAFSGHGARNVQGVPALRVPVRKPISAWLQPMRRRIRNQHGDLRCIRAPRQAQGVAHCGRHCLRPVAAALCMHRVDISFHFCDTLREREAPGDVAVILRRVVAVSDECEPHVCVVVGHDALRNVLDVLLRCMYVAGHGARAIAHETQIQLGLTINCLRLRRMVAHWYACKLSTCTVRQLHIGGRMLDLVSA